MTCQAIVLKKSVSLPFPSLTRTDFSVEIKETLSDDLTPINYNFFTYSKQVSTHNLVSIDDVSQSLDYTNFLSVIRRDSIIDGDIESFLFLNSYLENNPNSTYKILEKIVEKESEDIVEITLVSILYSNINKFTPWFRDILKILKDRKSKLLRIRAEHIEEMYKDYFLK